MADMSRPLKNVAFTLSFSLFKTDGTIIANPGTYTKKVSVDGGAIADITAAVTEEDTTYGQLSLVLSTSEMNGDFIWVMVKDDTAGCIPFVCSIYPAAAQVSVLTAANVNSECDTAISDAALATAANLATVDGIADDIKAAVVTNAAGADIAADIIALKAETAAIVEDTGTTLPATLTTIDSVVDGIVTTMATFADSDDIADAVWDEATAGHTTAGSASKAVIDILEDTGTTLDTLVKDVPTNAELTTALGTADDATLAAIAALKDFDPAADTVAHVTLVDTTTTNTDMVTDVAANVTSILGDTNELQTDLVDGGRLDLLVDAIKAKTDNLPTDPADQSAVEAAITAAHATTNGKIDTVDALIDVLTQLARNRVDTNPTTGVMTIYADDSTTPLFTANIYADVDGLTQFDGTGANRRNRLA